MDMNEQLLVPAQIAAAVACGRGGMARVATPDLSLGSVKQVYALVGGLIDANFAKQQRIAFLERRLNELRDEAQSIAAEIGPIRGKALGISNVITNTLKDGDDD